MRLKLTFLITIIFLITACNFIPNKNYEVQFIELGTKTDASLRGLFIVDENIIWASGSKGTVLVSEDGGENWIINTVPGAEENDFRSIHAWNENRAMIFGVAGPQFGFLTENGGENWEVVFQDSTEGLFFNSLKFADNKNGLAVSDPVDGKFFVLRTEDGGKNWNFVGENNYYTFQATPGKLAGFVAGGDGRIGKVDI